MPVSQNGWSANDRSVIETYVVGNGIKVALREGDAGFVLQHFANWFDANIRDIDLNYNNGDLDDWGYAERPIRGGSDLSNHASGTAIDINATQWPLGSAPSKYLTAAEVAKVRAQLKFYDGVIRWGGDYTGRKDPMHFEINSDAASVARVAAKIRGEVAQPAPAPAPSGDPDVRWIQERLNYWGWNLVVDGVRGIKTTTAIREFQKAKRLASDGIVGPKTRAQLAANKVAPAGRATIKLGSNGNLVRDLQQKLKTDYPLYGKYLVVDGDFGAKTNKAVKTFQQRAGLTVDGIVGPATWRALGF